MVNLKKLRKDHKSEKGSFLIEFSLLLPFIILILGFVMTVGQGMLAKNIVQNAAFQGARLAVVETSYRDGLGVAQTTAEDMIKPIISRNNDFDLHFTTDSGGWTKGDIATCTVTTSFKPLFPFLGYDSMNVSGQMSMMVENDGSTAP